MSSVHSLAHIWRDNRGLSGDLHSHIHGYRWILVWVSATCGQQDPIQRTLPIGGPVGDLADGGCLFFRIEKYL